MGGLSSIVGQSRAVEILRTAIAAGKVHHAYLFEGPEGVGKATTARALAMALNCDAGGCGSCEVCHKVASGNHPDVLTFDMTPKGLTERVRELVAQVGFRPHEGRARVVLLDPADDLAGPQERAEPANVLLKTLEEPPADTHFVLVTAKARRLPITVRSRCQRIRFLPLEDAAIEQLLVDVYGASPADARAAAAQAGGSVGRALGELAADEEAQPAQTRARLEALLQSARKGDPQKMFELAGELDRDQAEAACLLLQTVLRDALLVREELHRGRVSPARADFASQLFGDRPSVSLHGALRAADETLLALRGNVAPALALEELLLRLAPARPSRGAFA
jgi:DNA polymerase-3 subunit delta'